jgi:membrane protein DedA with SNARE-associated domain
VTLLSLTDFFYDRGWDFAGDLLGNLSDWFGGMIDQCGVVAAFGLLFLEESGVPIPMPGDVMVMYAGYQVGQETLPYWQALICCVAAVSAGSSILYGISRRYGVRIVARFGHYVHCPPSRIETVRPIMARWGILAVIFGRHIPGMRVPITLLAGMLRFPYPLFLVGVAISTTIWAGFFLVVGIRLGPAVEGLTHPHGFIWLVVIVSLLGLGLSFLWWRRWWRRRAKRLHLRRAAA